MLFNIHAMLYRYVYIKDGWVYITGIGPADPEELNRVC